MIGLEALLFTTTFHHPKLARPEESSALHLKRFAPGMVVLTHHLSRHHLRPMPVHIANPPESSCLGSPAASNVPLGNLLILCAVLRPVAIYVTLCPLLFMNATVSLL